MVLLNTLCESVLAERTQIFECHSFPCLIALRRISWSSGLMGAIANLQRVHTNPNSTVDLRFFLQVFKMASTSTLHHFFMRSKGNCRDIKSVGNLSYSFKHQEVCYLHHQEDAFATAFPALNENLRYQNSNGSCTRVQSEKLFGKSHAQQLCTKLVLLRSMKYVPGNTTLNRQF